MASCEATRLRHRACARAVSARRTPWSSPSPLVKTQHKTQLLASVYRTFYLAKLLIFVTRKGPSTHVIDVTSFVKTCQQEIKGGSHQLHFYLSNVDSGQKLENLLSSYGTIAVNLLNPLTTASSNPFRVGSRGWGTLVHQNHAAGEKNGSIMVGMYVSLCLASKKSFPRGSFSFPSERT